MIPVPRMLCQALNCELQSICVGMRYVRVIKLGVTRQNTEPKSEKKKLQDGV